MRIVPQFLEIDKTANKDLISGTITLPRIIRGRSFILNRKKTSFVNSLSRRKSLVVTPLYSQSGGGNNTPEVKLITPSQENVESAQAALKREREEPYLLQPGDDVIMPPVKRRKTYKRKKQIGQGHRQVGQSKRQVGRGKNKQVGRGKNKQIGKGRKKRKTKKKKQILFDQFSLQ